MSTVVDDHIALPAQDALMSNMTCHFYIGGRGYDVYKWDAAAEGGRAAHQTPDGACP